MDKINMQRRINGLEISNTEIDPNNRLPLMRNILWCRDELKVAKQESVRVRRAALTDHLANDERIMNEAIARISNT